MQTHTLPTRRFFSVLALLLAGCASLLFWLGGPSRAVAVEPGSPQRQVIPSGGTPTPCGPDTGWTMVSAPNAGSYSNGLYGVASISPTDAWAVGEQYESSYSSYVSLIEHWNGNSWSVVQGSPYSLNLRSVTALASNDVWAVGWMGGYGFSPFTEHWDGSHWTYVDSPISRGRRLYGVSAVSTNDVWAVGVGGARGVTETLIIHWNGAQWNSSPSPSIPNGALYGVAAIAANDVWAVGTSDNGETVTLHWNGTEWSRVASPNSGAYINVLTSVSATSSSDIWAVGYWATSGVEYHGYTIHWDGSQWSAVANPTGVQEARQPDDPTPAGTYLYGVSAVPGGEVWAVGRNLQRAGSTGVTLHLVSGTWTSVTSPNPGYANTHLHAVSSTSAGGTWAVGAFDTSSYGYTEPLAERYSDGCPNQTPVPPSMTPLAPTSTRTSVPAATNTTLPTSTHTSVPAATNTATPTMGSGTTATRTAIPTSTVCAPPFSDVGTGDYFYAAVQHAVCAGAISGYADNTFRPYNNMTRGQTAKLVTMFISMPINTTGGPHFTDVPAGNPFYAYIETAYNAGVISGYSDMTFRWSSDVTRGQICKIVVLANGWELYIPQSPTFSDVPASNLFYSYVETAAHKGIISGYAGGTFRPANNATRGQITKIVYNALSGLH